MSLIPRFVYGSLDLTDYPYSVEFGSDFGAPESVMAVMSSLMSDGDILSRTRRGNRTITLTVLVEGADLAEVASNVAALVGEAERAANTLAVDPGDGFGATTVWKTFTGEARQVRDDDMEAQGYRRVVLEIPAEPFARSVGLVIDDAGTPPSDGGTLLLDCESTTGWAPTATPAVGSEYVVDAAVFSEGAADRRSPSQD